jgi:di/tricarboxylate transporter
LERVGEPPMGMFEITAIGAPLLLIGLVVLVAVAPRLVPQRHSPAEGFDEAIREFTVAMRVVAGGPLDGVSVADAGLRDLQGVFLVQLERDGNVHAPVGPGDRLAGGDLLSFAGKVDQIVDLQRMRGLEPAESHHAGELKPTRQRFFEAVVGANSHLAGHTLKEVGFRGRYGAAVLAIHRAGERVDAKLGEVRLEPGDTLLLVGDETFDQRWRESQDFLLVASLGDQRAPARHSKAPWVGAIAVGLIGTAAVGLLSILEASLVAAFALVAVGAVSLREARDAVDLNVVVLIAAAFGIGEAMAESGLAREVAGVLLAAAEPLGDLGVLLAVLVATVVLTELVTNNAAAVLMFPIAVAAGDAAGVDLRPLAMGVAVAASASFLTPIGYQTNTMVYGLGGYRFSDFARLGAPLTVLVLATATALIPLIWPL